MADERTKVLDPMEFIIPASDTNGHSSRFWFRGIPQLSRQIDQVVSAKTFPYRTKGDLLRHAVVRHMRWLREQGGVTGITTQVDLMLDMMRDEELNSDFLQVFEKMSQRISTYTAAGNTGEAIRLVRRAQDFIKGMPEGYWRTRYETEIRMKFGYLLDNGKKAGLGQVTDD